MTLLQSLRHGVIAGLAFLLIVGLGLKAADFQNSIYSETDGSNTASSLWAEGMAPSAVNDNMRGMTGALVRWYNHTNATTASTGSLTGYVLTYAVTPAQYATGDVYKFRASFTNQGSSTVNINGLGPRTISTQVTAGLMPGFIRNGQIVELSYDPATGTFQMLNPPANGSVNMGASPQLDKSAVGPQSDGFFAGDTLNQAELVYLGGSSTWVRASAQATATSQGFLAIALSAATSGGTTNVAFPGTLVRNSGWSWSAGVPLYVSVVTGGLTSSQPVTTNHVMRVIGWAVNATTIWFQPSPDYITLN